MSVEKSKLIEGCGIIAAYCVLICLLGATAYFTMTTSPFRLPLLLPSIALPGQAPPSGSGDIVEILPSQTLPEAIQRAKAAAEGQSPRFPLRKTDLLDKVHDGNGPGVPHAAAWVYVINDAGQLLLQQRDSSERICPGKWGAVEKHHKPLEKPFTAAARGLHEEFGWEIDYRDIGELMPAGWLRLQYDNGLVENQLTEHLYMHHPGKEERVPLVSSGITVQNAANSVISPPSSSVVPTFVRTWAAKLFGINTSSVATTSMPGAPEDSEHVTAARFVPLHEVQYMIEQTPDLFCSPDHRRLMSAALEQLCTHHIPSVTTGSCGFLPQPSGTGKAEVKYGGPRVDPFKVPSFALPASEAVSDGLQSEASAHSFAAFSSMNIDDFASAAAPIASPLLRANEASVGVGKARSPIFASQLVAAGSVVESAGVDVSSTTSVDENTLSDVRESTGVMVDESSGSSEAVSSDLASPEISVQTKPSAETEAKPSAETESYGLLSSLLNAKLSRSDEPNVPNHTQSATDILQRSRLSFAATSLSKDANNQAVAPTADRSEQAPLRASPAVDDSDRVPDDSEPEGVPIPNLSITDLLTD